MGLEQIVQPRCPSPFFPGHVQLTLQTVDKLQNTAGFGFDNGFHYQLAAAIRSSVTRRSEAEPCTAQRSEGRASSRFDLLKQSALS